MNIKIVKMRNREFLFLQFPDGTIINFIDEQFLTLEEYEEIKMLYTFLEYKLDKDNIQYAIET